MSELGRSGRSRRTLRRFRLLQKLVGHELPMRLLDPFMAGFNPFVRSYRNNPYPTYRALRERSPVLFHPVLRVWLLTRHADVVHVLRGAEFSVERSQTQFFKMLEPERNLGPDLAAAAMSSLLMVDPPDHTRMRRLVTKAFTPRVVDALRPRIAQIVDELLDRVAHRGTFELIEDFAYPLPVIVIGEMLGVPAEDRDRFKRWSDDLSVLLDPFELPDHLDSVKAAFREFRAYFTSVFEERRREPRDDLISSLVRVEEEGDRLNETELYSITMLILGAGHETTTNLLGNAVITLLEHPRERRRLTDDLGLVESAVEEFLRYDSPVQTTDRVATEDCEIGGQRIQAGQLVGVLLGAANRDPDAFPDADRFDVGRDDNRHVAFGQGAHFCLGAALARAEARIAIAKLLERFPNFSGRTANLRRKRSLVLRGVEALPLHV